MGNTFSALRCLEGAKKYTQNTIGVYTAAYKHCGALHDKPFKSITPAEFQSVIDRCRRKHATREHIYSLLLKLIDYAKDEPLIDIGFYCRLSMNSPDDDGHGVPFSENKLSVFWKHSDDHAVEMILIMCYSGYRIRAYTCMEEINLEEECMKGAFRNLNRKAVFPNGTIRFLNVCNTNYNQKRKTPAKR